MDEDDGTAMIALVIAVIYGFALGAMCVGLAWWIS